MTIFDAETLAVQQSFFAYDPSFRGGVNITTGRGPSGGGTILTGAGVGGSSNLRIFTSATGIIPSDYSLTDSIYVGSSSDTGGVVVGADTRNYGSLVFTIANPLSAHSTAKVYRYNKLILDSSGNYSLTTLPTTVYGQDDTGTPSKPGVTDWGHIGSFPT